MSNNSITRYLFIIYPTILGLIVGVLTVLGQATLTNELNSLANSGAMWLIPAYFISTFWDSKFKSIVSCFMCHLGEILGYYIFEAIFNHHKFFISNFMIVWSIIAIVSALIFGLGAYLSKHSQKDYIKSCSKALLPSVFIAEGSNILTHKEDYSHMLNVGYMWLILAIILMLIIFRKDIIKKENLFSILIVSTIGILGYQVLFFIL